MSDAPTRAFDAPEPDAPSPGTPPPDRQRRGRGLLIALICVAAALVIAIVVALVLAFTRGTPTAAPSPTPTATSAAPSPTATSATPSPTPTPTPTATSGGGSGGGGGGGGSTAVAITGYTITPTKVDCSGGATEVPIHIAWKSANGTAAYFGVNAGSDPAHPGDAKTNGMGWTLPANGTSDADFPDGYRPYTYPCGNASTRYTITVVGATGRQSELIVVTRP